MRRGMLLSSAMALVAIAAMLPTSSSAATTFGFSTSLRNTLQKVTCATGLQASPRALYCWSPAIKQDAYDHRGVVQLLPDGRARIVRSGNDVLLAIDGLLPRNAGPRLLLRTGRTWSRAGYSCSNRAGTITCRRAGHGFILSPRRLQLF